MTKKTQNTKNTPEGNHNSSGADVSDLDGLVRCRKWMTAYNNYTEDDYKRMEEFFTKKGWTYVIGKEIAPTTGTPHLQVFVQHKNAIQLNLLKEHFPKTRWLKANGSAYANLKYCSKEDKDCLTNITDKKTKIPKHVTQYDDFMKQEFNEIKWFNWQQEVLDIIESKPDRRKVFWFYEETGNVGKSFLAQYIDWKYNAIIANGKQSDVFNQYKTFLDTEEEQPTVAIIDIPRSHKEYVCYSTMEKIKDGLVYSGKYEGGKLRLIPHHLIIFANFEPQQSKLSEDRWVIKNITNN